MSQPEKINEFKTGATRSADANHLDFTSLPLVGLIAVARTSSEGGTKYDRFNYMQGMPVHDTLNHSIRHIVMWLLGDRSEPHLEHASWGLLASVQQNLLDPDLSAPHLLGPGATITPEMQAYMDSRKEGLAARRKAGEFADIGNWSLKDLPEIQTILKQRDIEESKEENADTPRRPWNEVVNETIKDYVRGKADTIINKTVTERLSAIRDTSAMVFDSANDRGERFRVEHDSSGDKRICRGFIWRDNKIEEDQSPSWDHLLVACDSDTISLMLTQGYYPADRVLVVTLEEWNAGKTYSIDSDWGWASASAKSSKITGEVTRTEKIHGGQGEPGSPLPDESYLDFLVDGVRVYFKKS